MNEIYLEFFFFILSLSGFGMRILCFVVLMSCSVRWVHKKRGSGKKNYCTQRSWRQEPCHATQGHIWKTGQKAEDSAVGEGYRGVCGKGKAGSAEQFRTGSFVIWTGFGLLGWSLVTWQMALRWLKRNVTSWVARARERRSGQAGPFAISKNYLPPARKDFS